MDYKGYKLYLQNKDGKFEEFKKEMKTMKQTITRCDGITYERTTKENNYDKIISMRINNDVYEKLVKLAETKGIKPRTLIREILEEYIGD